MCGIFGIASVGGISLSDRQVEALRDRLAHRGPDSAGLWRSSGVGGGGVVLAHRRLVVIDPSPDANQPMVSPGLAVTGEQPGRYILVYNGELYNDAELRRELGAMGVTFRTKSDTETVLLSLMMWGRAALSKFRGMFALALHDTREETLLLARDPLGIKPLYYFADEKRFIFASEPSAILAHPDVPRKPDLAMVSAYVTTIRTVLGERTMWEGVRAVRPGGCVWVDVSGERVEVRPQTRSAELGTRSRETAVEVRECIVGSVGRHLRSDVPTCALLSGGLDSTIITSIAREEMNRSGGRERLRTYCAGCPLPTCCGEDASSSDLCVARRVAELFGTDHAEALISREMFLERWEWMVGRLGVPLSTPNEVAIHAVAERLRADGCVVTLSGEGADELFGGYEIPLSGAERYLEEIRSRGSRGGGEKNGALTPPSPRGRGSENGIAGAMSPGMFELQNVSWVAPAMKATVMSDDLWQALDGDAWLHACMEGEFAAALEETGGEHSLATHLAMQRRINLTGLLQRLDTATMLAGVEGRTPFADIEVARMAASLPMGMKFESGGGEEARPFPERNSRGTATMARARTKIALREAFEGDVPEFVMERAKASFPLPFQSWVGGQVDVLKRSELAREVFSPAAIAVVCEQPEKLWHLAWPMINIAVWGEARGAGH
ncbi:MAG TPA: asparagine synthase (glutamine-hydrolyzing) [Phycisphaerales bacterium]|nr:asparagine synthase (glutamine-hydrolyzing) [Phycisphaerales bacterium]